MMTICCTAKLLKRTGFPVESLVPDPTTALGNWYANILFFHHAQVLLFVSDKSRLAVVTPAREVRSLARHLTQHLAVLLARLGAPPACIEAELHEMSVFRYATTRSRSVLGTMNDFKFQIEAGFYETGEVDPLDNSLYLSRCLVGPVDYYVPGEVALDLLRKRYPAA